MSRCETVDPVIGKSRALLVPAPGRVSDYARLLSND